MVWAATTQTQPTTSMPMRDFMPRCSCHWCLPRFSALLLVVLLLSPPLLLLAVLLPLLLLLLLTGAPFSPLANLLTCPLGFLEQCWRGCRQASWDGAELAAEAAWHTFKLESSCCTCSTCCSSLVTSSVCWSSTFSTWSCPGDRCAAHHAGSVAWCCMVLPPTRPSMVMEMEFLCSCATAAGMALLDPYNNDGRDARLAVQMRRWL